MAGAEIPSYRWWPLTGAGIAHFGVDERWVESPQAPPAAEAIVAEVEAVAVCASDAKMVRLGSAYPLFRGRDLAREPICLGHELALRIAAAGDGVPDGLRPGLRVGVQPDVYRNGHRSCIGVNIQGGMADRIVLGPEVLNADGGSMVFPVDPRLSRAATALLEPLGCLEGAFRSWGRNDIRPGGRLVVLCGDPAVGWVLDRPLPAGRIDLVGIGEVAWQKAGGPADDAVRCRALASVLADDAPIDDCLVLGEVRAADIGGVYDRLASGGTFTWLAEAAVPAAVPVDLAHFHYDKLTQRGARSSRMSDAWARPVRHDYRPGGRALVFGASGAMGRMHLMRALESPAGPATVVAVARRHDKLAALVAELEPLAHERGRALAAVATESARPWGSALQALAPDGFDEVIVVAPGGEAMQQAVPFVGRNGLLIGFAGTRPGEVVDLPLGRLVTDGISVTASSGSTVADQLRVVERTLAGTLRPESLIAAVGGFPAMKEGLAAVLEGRFSGKVLILPLLNWPLMALPELFATRPHLRRLAGPRQSWSKAIEDSILG